MDDEERRAALQLHLATGIGPRLHAALVEHFGSALAASEADAASLAEVEGIGRDGAAKLRRAIDRADADAEAAKARAAGVRLVFRGEADYPVALTYLVDAPPVLYVRGTLVPEDAQAVAVVGMRRCSLYGHDQAERLAGGLARAGFTVVSGLARGIDGAAHEGALKAGGRTIAVLGNGLSQVYPPEHERLGEAVAASGALVTEFAMDTGARTANFPRRNRILAALALGTVVVEAGRQSGALITARLAAELGKEVFAVPNRADAPGAAGVHGLIRDGARLVESVADILEEFPDLEVAPAPGEDDERTEGLALKSRLSGEEARIVEVLDHEPMSLDALASRAGIDIARASAAMTLLELKGLVRALPGGRFARR